MLFSRRQRPISSTCCLRAISRTVSLSFHLVYTIGRYFRRLSQGNDSLGFPWLVQLLLGGLLCTIWSQICGIKAVHYAVCKPRHKIVQTEQPQHPKNKLHKGILHTFQPDGTQDGWVSVGQVICNAHHLFLWHFCDWEEVES